MPTRIVTSSALALLAAALTGSCGGPAPSSSGAAAPATPAITNVERYLPLQSDTVFAYETYSENTGEKGALMMQVRRTRPGGAELIVGGRAQRLEIVREGIRVVTGGWVLKAPLEPGARFKGQFGEVRVSAVDKAIQAPAGSFRDCIETIEENPAAQKRVTTVFCPDVGIVSLEAEGSLGDEFGRERALLRSHGPAVDVSQIK